MNVPLAIIAAIAENGVIGQDNRTPWRVPSDLKRFRALTLGKPLLMGRKTFQSIGRPLDGRETIILTRDPDFVSPPGIYVAHDLGSSLDLAQARARAMGAKEVIVAGGGDLYKHLIGQADKLYLTFVEIAPQGNVLFPQVDWSQWQEEERLRPQPEPKDEANVTFVAFRRR
jgi:dihydrofolate reductase